MDSKDTGILGLGSLDFTPAWARGEAGVKTGNFKPGKTDDYNEKGPRGDKKPDGFKKDRAQGKSAFRRGDRKERDLPPRPKMRPLEAEIKILPESKALGTIMRKLQQSEQAFKLKELAYFFLDNPEAVLLKITPTDPAERFTSCKACSFAAKTKEEIIEHILACHLGDYYEAKEIESEPPKGNFSCVAKCGLTGELLGPPNVHEFNSIVREMLRTKFPHMSEADYRAKIEMVRDAEAIETWRKSATKKIVYTPKGAGEDARFLTREQAENEFRRNMLESLIDEPKFLMITLAAALKCDYKPLVWAVKDAIQLERRAPYKMIFALRGAFHHRKMKIFRANDSRGPEFVISRELKEFDTTHAIEELAKVAKFIEANPCLSAQEICAELGKDAEKQLTWLVSTGHVVSFTNGVFSAVEKFPKYGPQWRKKKKGEAPKVEPKEQGENTETPVAEEVKPASEPVTAPVTEPVAAPVAEEAKLAAEPALEATPAAEPEESKETIPEEAK